MYKYFNGSYNTIQEVKSEYKKLAMKYHPDRVGGSTEIMQQINAEYDELIKVVANKQDKKVNINDNLENKFKEIIAKLVILQDITINIVGFYIWVGGNTKPYKELLKELGLLWSTNQKKWYYNGSTKKSRSCSKKSWAEITTYFGCVEIETQPIQKLASSL